jgi:hypothetical protein
MRWRKSGLPVLALAAGLSVAGCGNAGNTRNRTDDRMADHTGAMSGTGGTSTGTDLDRRNRTGSETGMNSGNRSTTGGGTSLSGSERGNHPNRTDQNR